MKAKADAAKKEAERLNDSIKEIMESEGITSHSYNGIKVTKVIQERQSLNEDKLIAYAHNTGVESIIKTKEYTDTDILEKKIYNEELSQDFLNVLEECISIKEVVTLRISKERSAE